MKLPKWLFMYFRTLPKDYVGKIVLTFPRNGDVTAERLEPPVSERVFFERHKEFVQSNGVDHGDPATNDGRSA